MPEEQDKKQELKEEQVVEELSHEDLKGLSGGFNASEPYML